MRLAVDSRINRHLRWALSAALLVVTAIPLVDRMISRPEAAIDASAASPNDEPPGYASKGLPITAPGRIQPKDGVITLAAPASAETGPAIVTQLHVEQGDWVRQGQVLATLRGREELEAALVGSQRKVALAHARLNALKSGGKADDLKALESEVQIEEATLSQTQADTRRAKQLRESGLLSAAAVESQESRLAIAIRALEAKRSRLNSLSSVRPADIAVAEAELRTADAEVEQVRAKLESTIVRAPADGRILALHAQPGQTVGLEGLLAFGKTAEMFVDAEVMEEDLARAKIGQKARITGDVLPGSVAGTVEEIGYLVGSREVFRTDPTAFTDARVVHVKIRADQPEQLERFINARVTAVIQQ
jgi:HlyD family secretion protein